MTQLVVWMNLIANAVGYVILAPVAFLPGWLSATTVAAVTGILALIAFKYTSNQRAIKRVRNEIKANLLALSLFKDNLAVSLQAQGRILISASKLFLLALVPMLVMIIPMSLLLGQLAMWYQARPLMIGEEAVITLKLSGTPGAVLPDVVLEPSSAVESTIGPVRVPSERVVCWGIRAREDGLHILTFTHAGRNFEKELAVGGGFLRTSPLRPSWDWTDALLYPREQPFPVDSPVQSIEVDYPTRISWTAGSKSWLVYWFLASIVAAFLFRPLFNVNL